MQESLNISWLQYDIVWHDVDQNLKRVLEYGSQIPNDTDILFVPETFTTGFSNDGQHLAQKMDGQIVETLTGFAARQNVAVGGSALIEEEGKFYNRFLFVHPSGKIETYDKRHLFTLAEEDQYYQQGEVKKIIEYRGWRICPMICYDLRFPVWCRNDQQYDLLAFVANWPVARIAAWDTLLQARAIENQAYVMGVNRVGTDGNGFEYVGHSAVYDFAGTCLQKTIGSEGLSHQTVSRTPMMDFRKKLDFLADRDSFTIQ